MQPVFCDFAGYTLAIGAALSWLSLPVNFQAPTQLAVFLIFGVGISLCRWLRDYLLPRWKPGSSHRHGAQSIVPVLGRVVARRHPDIRSLGALPEF